MIINKETIKEVIKNQRMYYDNNYTAIKSAYDEIFSSYTDYGCYPILFASEKPYGCLCAECAKKEYILNNNKTLFCDVFYEGETIQCDNCNCDIESAYGDPDNHDDDL